MWRTLRVAVIITVIGVALLGILGFYEKDISSRFSLPWQSSRADTREGAWVLPLHQPGGLLLSGLPAYGRMTFLLPLESGVENGQVHLRFRTEVPDTVYATLRIAVNETRRVETVLLPGGRERNVSFDLTAEDLSRKSLSVTYSLTGTSTVSICGADQAAIVVQFLPDSRLEIRSRDDSLSVADRFRLRGKQVSLAWRPTNDQDAAEHLLAAAQAINAGIPFSFSNDGKDEHFMLEDIRHILPRALTQNANAMAWPLAISLDGTNAGTREFTGRTVWRYRYKASDLPDSRLPGMLNYAMRLGPMMTNGGRHREWMLWVKLNGRLLSTKRSSEGIVQGSVVLPAAVQSEENTLEISAGRPFGVDGACNVGPTYVAELLPESRLLAGNVRTDELTVRLRSELGDIPVLSTGGLASLTAPEALAAARLLADLPAPARPPHQDRAGSSLLKVVHPSDLASPGDAANVYYREDGRGRIAIVQAVRAEPAFRNNAVVLLMNR